MGRSTALSALGLLCLLPLVTLEVGGSEAARSSENGAEASASEVAGRPAHPATAGLEGETLGSNQQAAMLRHVREREYWASSNAQGLQAPNRRHELRTYFGPTGIRVVDRRAAGSPALVSLSLAGFGRGEALTLPEAGEVVSEQGRVEIRRPDLLEWYENSPEGLEQGFTLEARPSGDGPVVVELSVAGGAASLRGDEVVFRTAMGRRLRYGAFEAQDATGRAVLARALALREPPPTPASSGRQEAERGELEGVSAH